jgi:hypothetical protein
MMTDAKTLLLELLAVIPDGGKSADLFAEDGVASDRQADRARCRCDFGCDEAR